MGRLGILIPPLFFVLGAVQLCIGFLGIQFYLGTIAAMIVIAAVFCLQILLPVAIGTYLPVTIGTYFGAVDVLGWPWWAGLLLTLPGLVFAVPAVVMAALQAASSRR